MGLDELHLRVLATSSEDATVQMNAKTGTEYLRALPSWAKEDTVLRLLDKGRHWILVVSSFWGCR